MIKLTDEMRKLVGLQRTGLSGNVDASYYQSLLKDWKDIGGHFPKDTRSVLDIGCGLAGIDLIAGREHMNAEIHLCDKDGVPDNIYYGYRESGCEYNYLDRSREFLEMNGISGKRIFTYDARADGFPERRYDVILSLISCGFHYPAKTYLDRIKRCSPKIVILDIRKHSGQMPDLSGAFASVEVIADYERYERILCK